MPMVTPIIGLVATLAPTLGPTGGGNNTHVMSWHMLLFINVVPGIGSPPGVLALVDFDKPQFKLLEKFDWWGLASMAGFLGALEYVLEEGPQYDWFQDPSVFWLGIVCVLSAVVFFRRVLTIKEPIVDIRAFTDRNFALGSMFSFCVGIGLYGLTYIYPRYLAEVRGYSALMIGETMFVSGIAMFLTAPIVGKLMTRVDLRYMIAAGLIIFAIGSWQMTWITRDYDFYELLWPQIFRGVGMMMAMVPINNIALGTLPPDRLKNASGLFNLTRNLGGAVGLALINTILDTRTDLHILRLQERVNWGNSMAVETLNMLTQKFQGMGNASLMALKQLSLIVHRQAVVMSFGDAFFLLTCFYLVLSAMVFFVRKPNVMGPPPDAH
jgi:DHA2 family multidrug resistance protein